MTVLLFIYNTLLGYVVISYATAPGKLILLVLIIIDYLIIFYFFANVTKMFKKPAETAVRKRGRKS